LKSRGKRALYQYQN